MSLLQLRSIIYTAIALLVTFLLYQAVAPLGTQTYTITPCQRTFTISKLAPATRVNAPSKQTGECAQRIIGEPVYFNVFTQRPFNEARVTLTYRTHNVPVVEVGIVADTHHHYRLHPLENATLDTLAWPRVHNETFTLFQRTPTYDSISAFLDNLPADKVRTYHAALPINHAVAHSFSATAPAFRPLRGAYRFYATNPETGDLTFTFSFADLNNSDDRDPVTITLSRDDTLLAQRTIADERGGEGNNERAAAGAYTLSVPNAPGGVYTVQVQTTDDSITTDLQTSATALSFANRVHLAQTDNATPPTLATDMAEIAFSTPNPASTQTVDINHDPLKIAEPFRQYTYTPQQPTSTVTLQKDGIIVAGTGVIAFARNNLFNPTPRTLTRADNLDTVDYIFTSYTPQNPTTDWRTRSVTVDAATALRYKNTYGFIISAPGLRADDDVEDWIEVQKITVALQGTSLWAKLYKLLH